MRTFSRILLVVSIASGLAFWQSAPAAAHATLQSTEPADGTSVRTAPDEVRLRFDEPVRVTVGGVRVFDSDGRRVDRGDSHRRSTGREVSARLRPGLRSDTYTVAWRVVSADGHPIRGAFVFAVGDRSAADAAPLAAVLGEEGPQWRLGGLVARALAYAGTLALAGGMVWVAFLDRRAAEARDGRRLLAAAAVCGLAGTVSALLFHGAEITGLGWSALVSPEVLGETLTDSVGVSALVRAVALAAFLIVWWAGLLVPPWAGLAAAVAATGSFLLTGHTVTSEPRWAVVLGHAAHLAAAAVWFGGLCALLVSLRSSRREDDPATAASLVSRFSLAAAVSLAVLLAAGGLLSWVEVRSFDALGTTYGWTLVAKIIVTAAVLSAALYNNRYLVPAIAESPNASDAWHSLRRTVTFEVGGLLGVLAITSALVVTQPAREEAGLGGIFAAEERLGETGHVHLVVDPNRAGENEIHMHLSAGGARPLQAEEVVLEMSMPEEDIGPIRRPARPGGPGHWFVVGPELSIPGEWVLQVRVRVSDFEEIRTRFDVKVNP
ncbi:MAG: copper resistance protein C [Acidimicrobiales bacterium]|nr:MAG: copper resistance protein C [Acidimicrobiales bacterium]